MVIIECAKKETVQMIYTSGTEGLKMSTASVPHPELLTIALLFAIVLLILTIMFMLYPKKFLLKKPVKVKHTNMVQKQAISFY